MTNVVPIFKELKPRKHHLVIVVNKEGEIDGIFVDNVFNYQVTIINKQHEEYEKEAYLSPINYLDPFCGDQFRNV